MAETAELMFVANSSQIVKAEQALESLNAEGAKTQSALNGIKERAKGLAGQMEGLSVSNRKVADSARKTAEIINFQQAAVNRSIGSMEEAALASAKMGNSFKLQKGAIQQASFQMQDFFVQVGSGQSAMTAFAQQGPQLASIFGPGGAVIGALIAVGAVIGGPFLKSLFDTKSATDQLSAAIESLNDIITETDDKTNVLSDAFAALAERSTTLSQAMVREALLKTRDALKEANDEANSLANSLSPSNLGGRFDRVAIYANKARKEFLAGEITLAQFNDQINSLFLQTPDPSKAFREVREELAEIADKARIAAERRDILLGGTQGLKTEQQNENFKLYQEEQRKIAQLEYEAEQARQAQVVKRLFEIEDSFRTEEQIARDSANEKLAIVMESNRLGVISAQEAADLEVQIEIQKQEKLRQIAEAQAATEKRINDQIVNQKISFYSQVASVIAKGAKEGSALQKAAFLAQQGLAVATTILSTEAAATAALAPPPIGVGPVAGAPLAATIRGIGYASAALQAGLAVGEAAARSQGGQVRPGQAYRVGEFGAETFVPNTMGRIVPNDSTSSGGKINLVTNVKVIGGTQNAQVTNTTTQIDDRKFVQDIVVDLMANVTSPARNALHKTSNVRPVGQR